jgi:hypothetical protein
MSESPEAWREPASVTVTRLICQVLVTLSVLAAGLLLVLTHPEYNTGVALVCGVVLGTWFAVPHELRWGRSRARRQDSEE